MNTSFIPSPLDPRLDDYRNIPDPELLRARGLFVAEGRLVVRRLLTESPFSARSLMLTEPALEALSDVLASREDLPAFVVPQAVMNDVAGFNIHRGCLAIGERPEPRPWQDVAANAHTLVVLDRVANADNVGSIFRAAAAFGVDGVLLDAVTTDPLYRKAIRTSMGAALSVPFARADPLPAVLSDLRRRGIATVALTPAATAPPLQATVAGVGERAAAFVVGHEGEGVSDAALETCELRARIPTTSRVDSLNVSAAAAIALYARSISSAAHEEPQS